MNIGVGGLWISIWMPSPDTHIFTKHATAVQLVLAAESLHCRKCCEWAWESKSGVFGSINQHDKQEEDYHTQASTLAHARFCRWHWITSRVDLQPTTKDWTIEKINYAMPKQRYESLTHKNGRSTALWSWIPIFVAFVKIIFCIFQWPEIFKFKF